MADDKAAKLKALQLTLDKLDKTYGKGSVMKLGDEAIEEVEAISSGSIGLDIALGVGGTCWTGCTGVAADELIRRAKRGITGRIRTRSIIAARIRCPWRTSCTSIATDQFVSRA